MHCFYVGDRAEALDRRAGGREAHELGRDGIHHGRRRDRFGSRAAAVHRALQRMHDGRIFSRQRQACAAGVRRFEQARAGLSPVVAAAAPSAGPRGVSRRRLLSAFAPARARRQDERRDGRRLADRAARLSKRRKATSRPTFRPTSSRSPTARSFSTRICSTRTCGPPSTSACRFRASGSRPRSRR